MRSCLKKMTFLLLLLLAMQLQAENIKQSFSGTFGPTSTPYPIVEQETDGWKYFGLYRNMATSYPARVFYGEAAVCLYAYGTNPDDAYLISPAKEGGVGWISFYYKMESAVTNSALLPVKMKVLISENGTDFTEIDEIEVNPADVKNFSYYSKVIDNPNAVKVKIAVPRPSGYNSYLVDLDELIITDSGSAHITAISGNTGLESELNQPVNQNITLKGSGFSGDVTLSVQGENSPFDIPASIAGASITESGYPLPVAFTPVKYQTTDFLLVNAAGLPELVFPLKGYGLERTVVEGFNVMGGTYDNGGSYNDFDYASGWEVKGGTTMFGTNYASYILEGDRSLRFWTSVVSPRKAGGVGTIFFKYRNYTPSQTVEFFTDISEDGSVWTQIDNTNATGGDYVPYIKSVNNPAAKYVRLRIDASTYSHNGIMIDEFVITENNQLPAVATGAATIVDTEGVSKIFNLPVTFSNISGNVSLSVSNPQFVVTNPSLTAAEASGVVPVEITYNPQAGVAYTEANLVISGGGLIFPVKIKISGYSLMPTLFTNFDGAWGATTNGNYTTDAGWSLVNGYRDSYNTLSGSPGAAYISSGGTLTSPPKSGGVGTVHFFAKSGYQSVYTISVSDNGDIWMPEVSDVEFNLSSYGEVEHVINNATAKFVRIEVSSSKNYMDIDNLTVTRSGKRIPHLTQVNQPSFLAEAGVEAQGDIMLQGEYIDSDLQIRFKSGAAFSLHGKNIIPANEINNTTVALPVYFQSETGTYFKDTLVVSGEDFSVEQIFPVQGYNKQDLIFQDFNGTFVRMGDVYSNNNINGWETINGSENSYGAIDGRADLNLGYNTGTLTSVPKSGGVGEVSFLYKNSSSVPVKISLYKSLSEAALTVLDTTLVSVTSATAFQYVFNNTEAVYVRIENRGTSYNNIYIDNMSVTAGGKGTPVATVSGSLLQLYAYKGETMTRTFEVSVASVESDITLSLKPGSAFAIDKTVITPEEGAATETVSVTYTPSGQSFVADTLIIDSKGLLKPVPVVLLGNILEDKWVQDFNEENFPDNADSDYVVDGWMVKNGRRVTASYEGAGALRLVQNITTGIDGSLTSPAKAGGVNNVSFYYRGEPLLVYVQTSADGDAWVDQDVITIDANMAAFQPYSKKIADPDAKFLRLQTASHPDKTSSYWWLWVDSIAIDAMPYLRQTGTVEKLVTTKTYQPVEVKVAGLLDSEAAISMKSGAASVFEPATNSLLPADLENGNIASFNVVFTEGATGIYKDTVVISGNNIPALEIPVEVDYTRPWLELVEPVTEKYDITEVPYAVSFAVKGLLNTNALVLQDDDTNFTLSSSAIAPDDLKDDAEVTVTVTLKAGVAAGTYTNEIRISNGEIEQGITIPLEFFYQRVGINGARSNVQVYFTGKDKKLTVNGAQPGAAVSVVDVQGRSIFRSTIQSGNEQFDLQLSTGVYLVKIGETVWKLKK